MFSAPCVCFFVCQHYNFQTIKRRMVKLGSYVHCTKISPEFECQRSRSLGTKKGKTSESSPLTVHSKACTVGLTQQAATDNTIAWSPRGDGSARWWRLRRWENQCMLSSFVNYLYQRCSI